jgi:flavin reductase (DIM6/NTAB) family NADH-FMN oxidoreductase RutF
MKKRLGALERLFPMPCVLVVGGTMEEADPITVAWINVIASTPPTVVMGLRDTRRSLELIRQTGELTVNVPSTKDVAAVDLCGLVSGHKADKIAASGLTLEPGVALNTPMIAECAYNLECRVTQEERVGAYVIVFAEIIEAHAEESILVPGTDSVVDMDALDPITYIPGAREYRGLGAKLADAYSIGKTLQAGSAGE